MQQHLMQMQPMMAAYYPNNVTTDHIQQYLDENKSLILKIVESQNSGKLSECAENQARLQRNLMYLAAIADSQPQPPAIHAQYPSSSVVQASGAHYLQQQQQQQQMSPQAMMAARSSMMYSHQQQQQQQQQQQPFAALQQHQAMHGQQLGMMSSSTGLHMLHGSDLSGGFPDYSGRAGIGVGTKQDHGVGGSGSDHGGDGLYLKGGGDDGN